MRDRTNSSVSATQSAFIAVHRSALRDLPNAGDDWKKSTLSKSLQEIHSRLATLDLIKKTDRTRENGSVSWKWEVPNYVDEAIEEMCRRPLADAAQSAMLPCGHNQFKNERGTEFIVCTHPDCGNPDEEDGERFTCAEVKAHQRACEADAETSTESQTEAETEHTDQQDPLPVPALFGGGR